MEGMSVDFAALAAWMDERDLGSGVISTPELLGGGTQNILLHFHRAERAYVLRRPPAHPRPASNETMRREMRVLAALSETTIPHPRLIAACPDEAVLGVAFYLMEPIRGFNPAMALPVPYSERPEWRREMAMAMVKWAARLGNLDPGALGLDGFGRPDGFLQRQTARWRAQFEGYSRFAEWPGGHALPGIDRIAEWLDRHRPAPTAPGLMHGDFHMGNAMFRFDQPVLAALVDWELATVGDPLMDLGWLLATWPELEDGSDTPVPILPRSGFPDADGLVGHYRAHSSRDLGAIDWYKVMGCFKLAVLLEGTHARACAGQAPRAVGERLHAGAVNLIERAVLWAQ